MMETIKEWIKRNFSMKDLGEAEYILGIKIYRVRSKRLIGLSQGTYINKILSIFNMANSKEGLLPTKHGLHLSKSQCPKTHIETEKMSRIPYASTIRSIRYAMTFTPPDFAYALSKCNRYQSNPA